MRSLTISTKGVKESTTHMQLHVQFPQGNNTDGFINSSQIYKIDKVNCLYLQVSIIVFFSSTLYWKFPTLYVHSICTFSANYNIGVHVCVCVCVYSDAQPQ